MRKMRCFEASAQHYARLSLSFQSARGHLRITAAALRRQSLPVTQEGGQYVF